MLGLVLHAVEMHAERDMVIRNIEQVLVQDAENQTAWLNLGNGGYWWHWYGSEYEAHAFYLKLLSATDPRGGKAAGVVKYLLNNRKHATYWNSTRDTALCVEAMADFLRASGEDKPDMTVEILLNDALVKTERITAENIFSFDNRFLLEGEDVKTGEHQLTVRRKGRGPVYFNAYLTNFTLEDPITAAGLEVKVQRKIYRLVRDDRDTHVAGSHGQAVAQRQERYRRELLESGAMVRSGDLIEVELELESKNDYEYIVATDFKAAGFESVEQRSGYIPNDMGAYVELRDNRVVFFVRQLARGRHSVAYRLRAEIPGAYRALPATIAAMYAPELRGNSDEIKLGVKDE
jgi:alpha-2-macroglobulin